MNFLMVLDLTQFWLDGWPGNEYFWISHKISGHLTPMTPLGVHAQWFETTWNRYEGFLLLCISVYSKRMCVLRECVRFFIWCIGKCVPFPFGRRDAFPDASDKKRTQSLSANATIFRKKIEVFFCRSKKNLLITISKLRLFTYLSIRLSM